MPSFPSFPNMPKPAWITISFDQNLQKITGKETEKSMISDGMPFLQFLFFLFSSYPEIQTTYPAGTLGFLVNGEPPREHTTLHDGDKLIFIATGKDGVTRTPWGFHGTFPSSRKP